MKLTQKDKEQLLKYGHTEEDFSQIELVLQKRYTKYDLNGKPITREQAIELLGRKQFLSGISRSAFHCTATRECDAGYIGFDSSLFFKTI